MEYRDNKDGTFTMTVGNYTRTVRPGTSQVVETIRQPNGHTTTITSNNGKVTSRTVSWNGRTITRKE